MLQRRFRIEWSKRRFVIKPKSDSTKLLQLIRIKQIFHGVTSCHPRKVIRLCSHLPYQLRVNWEETNLSKPRSKFRYKQQTGEWHIFSKISLMNLFSIPQLWNVSFEEAHRKLSRSHFRPWGDHARRIRRPLWGTSLGTWRWVFPQRYKVTGDESCCRESISSRVCDSL